MNKDNTLTVAHLLKALKDGRITEDMPIAVVRNDAPYLLGVDSMEIHRFVDKDEKVFCICTETLARPVSWVAGDFTTEVGLW
jgi:hypothetical protein